MEAASNRSIPYTITNRRPGDAAISVADPSQAINRLGWSTKRSLKDICRMGWPGSRPIQTAIARDTRHSACAGRRRSQPCPSAAALGDASQATTKRVDHPGESLKHHPLLRHGAGADRWPLHL